MENANPPPPQRGTTFIYVLKLCATFVQTGLRSGRKRTRQRRIDTSLDLPEAAKSGRLVLAGRTKEPGDKTFGIAIFRASDEAAARKFMESDPSGQSPN